MISKINNQFNLFIVTITFLISQNSFSQTQKFNFKHYYQSLQSTHLKLLYYNFTRLNGDPLALKQALCFYNKFKNTKFKANYAKQFNQINFSQSNEILIFDMTKSSKENRLYVINLTNAEIKSIQTSHGSGTGSQIEENYEYAKNIGNTPNSLLSNHGFLITGPNVPMKNPLWKNGLKLFGLETDFNNNAYVRDVMIHQDPESSGNWISSSMNRNEILDRVGYNKVQPQSQGCLMLPLESAPQFISHFQMNLKSQSGTLLYNYSNFELEQGEDYCGSL